MHFFCIWKILSLFSCNAFKRLWKIMPRFYALYSFIYSFVVFPTDRLFLSFNTNCNKDIYNQQMETTLIYFNQTPNCNIRLTNNTITELLFMATTFLFGASLYGLSNNRLNTLIIIIIKSLTRISIAEHH